MSAKLILTFTTIILIVLIFPPIPVKTSAVLIADFTMSTMIELSSKSPFCKLHTDRGDIQRMLLQADQRRVRQVPRESVLALEGVCENSALTGGESPNFQGGLGFIYPGTKWCGPGNLASDYADLGRYTEEDKCCREHDLCPNTLSPGECKKGLCNTGRFTRSHCDCDARFRRCLQAANTETANTLGAVFFNVVQVTCFRERNPCTTYQRLDTGFILDQFKATFCPIIFDKSKLFIPKNGRLISRLLNLTSSKQRSFPYNQAQVYSGRSISTDNDVSENSVYETITGKIGIKLASFGLIVGSFFREMANINFKDLANMFKSARPNLNKLFLNKPDIYYEPGPDNYYSNYLR